MLKAIALGATAGNLFQSVEEFVELTDMAG